MGKPDLPLHAGSSNIQRLAWPPFIPSHVQTHGLGFLPCFLPRYRMLPITQFVQLLKNEAKRCFLFHVEHSWRFFIPCFQLPLTLEV